MPFILIQGTFHLVGQTQAGNPTGFEPDGDSVQFNRPTRSCWTGSPRSGRRSCALKGVDALELHLGSTTSHGHWPTRHATSSPASFT